MAELGNVEERKDKAWQYIWNDRILEDFVSEYKSVGEKLKEIDLYQVTPNGVYRELINDDNSDFSGDLETVSDMLEVLEETGYIREYSNRIAPNYDLTVFNEERYNELGMTLKSIEATKERKSPAEVARIMD